MTCDDPGAPDGQFGRHIYGKPR